MRNQFNGALYIISKDELNEIETAMNTGESLNNGHLASLQQELFIVEDEPIPKCARNGDIILVTIETNSDCNLQCSYCYENDKGTRSPISPEVIEKILRYIENIFKQDKSDKILYVAFIGGEPLLCKDIVSCICNRVTELGNRYSRKVGFHIDTNGTIPFDDLFCSLDCLQVSVSLTPKIDHNKNRCGRGFDSYDRILKNLKQLTPNPQNELCIRYNTNDENISLFEEFVRYIRKNVPLCGEIEPMYTDEYEHTSFKNRLDIEAFKKWNSSQAVDILIENGYEVMYTLGGMLSMCVAYQQYSCKVYADGMVTLCNAMPHHDALCHISQICDAPELLEYYFKQYKLYDPTDDAECRECIELAHCMGRIFCRDDAICDYNHRFDDDILAATFVKYYLAGKGYHFPNMLN